MNKIRNFSISRGKGFCLYESKPIVPREMGKKIQLPDIPEDEQPPLVKSLLVLLEQFAERIQLQDEEIAYLKDEINILKGEKNRPKFKPSKIDQKSNSGNDDDPPKGGLLKNERAPINVQKRNNLKYTTTRKTIVLVVPVIRCSS